jgi:hypothetical protein
MPFLPARQAAAVAALACSLGAYAPAMADEVWTTPYGFMQWEETIGEIAVFNLYGDGVAPSELRVFLVGLGRDVSGGRGSYAGFWTAESGATTCLAGLTDPMGTTTFDWGMVELTFESREFPSNWTAQFGNCFDPVLETITGLTTAK